MLKRTFDVVASLVGLSFFIPFFLVVSVLIRITSKGPVFFRQERVGRKFKRFRIFKFRTMVVDAPSMGGTLTLGADPRITFMGRFLRASKFDELPQLINVLRGDMSLVGPRPEVPLWVDRFRADFEEILEVRPGITDLASVTFRDESSLLAYAKDPEACYAETILPRKIELSLGYLRRRSFLGDIWLIFRTLFRVFIPAPPLGGRDQEKPGPPEGD